MLFILSISTIVPLGIISPILSIGAAFGKMVGFILLWNYGI
jgi:H+/Cl- antiporter ClcA